MITVEDALAACLALARPVATETVALAEAGGRVLAAPVVAQRDQPPFAASAMDGYALRASEVTEGATFRVVGEAPAGHAWEGALSPGEALRIFTGAPLPAGADRIVIQENVTRDGAAIRITDAVDPGPHVRAAGNDFRAGATLDAPRRLGPAEVALAAAMNAAEVVVRKRPEVALIATGDELVAPGGTPRPDQIIASNTYGLKAMVEAEGARARLLPIARDNAASLRAVFALAMDADLIVTVGGASVGDHDLVGQVAADLGLERAFYKIAMRPGKPLMAGRLGDAALLGLPGNPVSALVCGHLFLVPMLRAMQGLPGRARRTRRAVLQTDLPPNGPRAHYMRATVRGGTDTPLPRIAPVASQDSARLGLLAAANALLIRPVADPAHPAGAEVRYLPLGPPQSDAD